MKVIDKDSDHPVDETFHIKDHPPKFTLKAVAESSFFMSSYI